MFLVRNKTVRSTLLQTSLEIEASSRMWAKTLGNPDFKRQNVSKWRILDLTRMIFNVDSNCIHFMFWIRALIYNIRHNFDNILNILISIMTWNQIPWHVSEIRGSSINNARGPFAPSLPWSNRIQWRILDYDPHDFQRRFQMYPLQVLNPSAGGRTQPQLWQSLRDLKKIDFLKSSFMQSRSVKCLPWWLLMPPQVSLSVLVHFQEHSFSMISGGFLVDFCIRKCPSAVSECPSVQVFKCPSEESASHPSHPQDECPKFK